MDFKKCFLVFTTVALTTALLVSYSPIWQILTTEKFPFLRLNSTNVGKLMLVGQRRNTTQPTNYSFHNKCNITFKAKHLMTITEARGRLGNNLFQLLALLGTSYDNCYTPVITTAFARYAAIEDVFDLSVFKTVDKIPPSWLTFTEEFTGTIYSPGILNLSHSTNLSLNGYFQSWRYFDKYKDVIKSKVRFRKEIRGAVDGYLSRDFRNKTKVCVHVRRGDFLREDHRKVGFSSASVGFITRAMTYFTEKFNANETVFIFLSDDVKWCKDNFIKPNVYFSPFSSSNDRNAAGLDLALMSNCDHSIVTSGSFGWLGAWFSDGHVVYFKGFPTPGSPKDKRMNRYDYYPPYWIGMM